MSDESNSKIRLFTDAPLGTGRSIDATPEQAHYLGTVMRRRIGDRIRVFNGRDGEWLTEITDLGKGLGRLHCREPLREQQAAPDLWLVFAPVKRMRLDFLAQKATEMGVARLMPVFTRHTNVDRVKASRLRANAIEAAEQSGRLSVPAVAEPVRFDALIADWPAERHLILADEAGGPPLYRVLETVSDAASWAVLIGPEGGFHATERAALAGLGNVHRAGLGPRILRADTAAIATITIWQSLLGDWQ